MTAAVVTTSESLPRDLPSLTSLRAGAALAVFVFHLGLFGVVSIPGATMGYTGVSFFFVLSGFVLTWSLQPGTSTRQFYRRRFARVYPSHLVVLVIVLAVQLAIAAPSLTPTVFLANLLLVQGWFADPAVVFGMNGPAWSLSCEAVFYLCFPLLVRGLTPLRPALRWAIPATWLTVVAVLASQSVWLGGFTFHFPLARMGEFVLGVVAALAIRDGWRPRWRLWVVIVVTVVVAAVLALLNLNQGVTDGVMAVPFGIAVVAAVMGDVRRRTRALGHRAFVYAGKISFAFYLVHELVIRVVVWADLRGAAVAVLALGVAMVLAIGLHHLVERPAQRRLSSPPARRSSSSARRTSPRRRGLPVEDRAR
ncbi:acyltransferase family protein [Pengzhenrongella frigida]|nr:acyltransferase [Cellulomonas sp. HLT2-17]